MAISTQRIFNKLYQISPIKSGRESNLERINDLINQRLERLSILFICSGNICRSAFADAELKNQIANDKTRTNILVSSAGTHTENGLPADSDAIKHARIFNVDLSHHRTTKIQKELLENANLILAMEPWHMLNSFLISPRTYKKTFLLSTLDTDPNPTTIDPYNKPQSVFEYSFNRIRGCLVKLVEMLPKTIV